MRIHIVQKGDTLWKIARQYGVSFEDIKRLNAHLANLDYIVPGMEIILSADARQVPQHHPMKEHVKEEVRQPVKEHVVKEEVLHPVKEHVKEYVKERPKEVVKEHPVPPPIPQPVPIIPPPVLPPSVPMEFNWSQPFQPSQQTHVDVHQMAPPPPNVNLQFEMPMMQQPQLPPQLPQQPQPQPIFISSQCPPPVAPPKQETQTIPHYIPMPIPIPIPMPQYVPTPCFVPMPQSSCQQPIPQPQPYPVEHILPSQQFDDCEACNIASEHQNEPTHCSEQSPFDMPQCAMPPYYMQPQPWSQVPVPTGSFDQQMAPSFMPQQPWSQIPMLTDGFDQQMAPSFMPQQPWSQMPMLTEGFDQQMSPTFMPQQQNWSPNVQEDTRHDGWCFPESSSYSSNFEYRREHGIGEYREKTCPPLSNVEETWHQAPTFGQIQMDVPEMPPTYMAPMQQMQDPYPMNPSIPMFQPQPHQMPMSTCPMSQQMPYHPQMAPMPQHDGNVPWMMPY